MKLLVKTKGGPGSGNFGHAGIPGQVGGSAPRGSSAYVVNPIADMESWGNSKDLFPSSTSMSVLAKELKKNVAHSLSSEFPKEKDSGKFIHQWAESSNDTDYRSLSIQRDAVEEFGVELSDWQKAQLAEYDTAMELYGKATVLYNEYETVYREVSKLSTEFGISIEDVQDYLTYDELVAKYPKLNDSKFDTYKNMWEKKLSLTAEIKGIHREILTERRITYVNICGIRRNYEPVVYDPSKRLQPAKVQRAAMRRMYDNTQEFFKDKGITEVVMYRGINLDNNSLRTGTTVSVKGNALESWSADPKIAAKFGRVILAIRMPVERILSTPMTGFGCLKEYEYVVLGGRNDEAYVAYSDFDIDDYVG